MYYIIAGILGAFAMVMGICSEVLPLETLKTLKIVNKDETSISKARKQGIGFLVGGVALLLLAFLGK